MTGGRAGWLAGVRVAWRATAAQPRLWLLALLGFLVRGGMVLVLLPILVLPSPIGAASVIGLRAVTITAQPTPWLIAVVAIGAVVLLAWFLLGGLVGAAVDRELVLAVHAVASPTAGGEGSPGRPGSSASPGLWLLVAARAVVTVPLAVVLAWAMGRIVSATYQELTVPTDIVRPLVVRTLLTAGDAVVVVVIAWLVAEAVGGVAVRRLLSPEGPSGGLGSSVFGGPRQVALAVVRGVGDLVRSPITSITTIVVGIVGACLMAAPGLAVTVSAWDLVLLSVRAPRGSDPTLASAGIVLDVLVLAASWLLLVAGVAVGSAWRSALWTAELDRRAGLHGPIEGLDKQIPVEANRTSASTGVVDRGSDSLEYRT